jgi:hypothetical protein
MLRHLVLRINVKFTFPALHEDLENYPLRECLTRSIPDLYPRSMNVNVKDPESTIDVTPLTRVIRVTTDTKNGESLRSFTLVCADISYRETDISQILAHSIDHLPNLLIFHLDRSLRPHQHQLQSSLVLLLPWQL